MVSCPHPNEKLTARQVASRGAGFRTHLPVFKDCPPRKTALGLRAPRFPRYIFVILDLERDALVVSPAVTVGGFRMFTCDDRPALFQRNCRIVMSIRGKPMSRS